MGHALPAARLTAEEFLAWEQAQPERHEFYDGEVFAMAGGEDRNADVAGNVYMALRQHLDGGPCRAYTGEVRALIEEANCYFYPDVFVTCSKRDRADRLHKREPLLVVEVLSATTEAFDRGAKFEAYRRAPSLRELVLIDPQRRTSDVYRKGDDGLWVLHPFAADDSLRLASVDLEIVPATLWANVDDDAAADE